jgi:hypothetical protein
VIFVFDSQISLLFNLFQANFCMPVKLALATLAPRKKAELDIASLVDRFVDVYSNKMLPFVRFTSATAISYTLKNATHDMSPSLKDKTGFYVIILCSLLTITLADTDCEILNSGIPSISATDCCTTNGITCVDGRVTEMYDCIQS